MQKVLRILAKFGSLEGSGAPTVAAAKEIIAETPDALTLVQGAVGKTVVAQALLPDAADIDIGAHDRRVLLEARRFGKLVAQLVDGGVAVPGQVGRRFAGAVATAVSLAAA